MKEIIKELIIIVKIFFYTFKMNKLKIRDCFQLPVIGHIYINNDKIICEIFKDKKRIRIKHGEFGYVIYFFDEYYELKSKDIEYFLKFENVSLNFVDLLKTKSHILMNALYKKSLSKQA